MVAMEHDSQGGCYFVLRPDFVVNWRLTMTVYAITMTMPIGLALGLTLLGFWPVLLFVGITVAVLGGALYASARRSQECEVIEVRAESVEVRKGRRKPEREWVFPRHWTEVKLRRSGHDWYPSVLVLRSGGREVSVGGFLQEEERVRLARALARTIGPMGAPGEGV